MISKREIRNAATLTSHKKQGDPTFRWTENITDLVELIYALYYSQCINDGKIKINQIVTAFEKLFGVKIINCSHTFGKNCERVEQTPFIKKLLKRLISKISERDN